ncbi:hypothetical protein [Cellulosimicrobium cellulans]|uniref:hypothetical protein n=1 Tax=Cellulosimicrobium cellulans TaxID=1710 RepID=UPI0037F10D74
MSAFILCKDHVDYLVEAVAWASTHPLGRGQITVEVSAEDVPRLPAGTWGKGPGWTLFYPAATDAGLEFLGFELWRVNELSVRRLYGDDEPAPGPIPTPTAALYQRQPVNRALLNPAQVMQAAACWRYQSSEFSDWESTLAAKTVDTLWRDAATILMRSSADAEELQWEWTRDQARQTA